MPQERAAVLASSGNQLGTREIEAALRAQWSVADLTARDARTGQQRDRSIYFGEDEATWEDDEEQDEWPDEEAHFDGGEEEPWDDDTEDEQAALMAAQEAEAEALVVVQGAPRTCLLYTSPSPRD